jgi:hypothetical protein
LTNDLKAEKEVEILKSNIFKRPIDVSIIHKEVFKVTERALVFKPMYKITATHIKTQKRVNFLIDGVNGKISSKQKEEITFLTKEGIGELGSKIFTGLKKQSDKAYNFVKKTGKLLIKKDDSSTKTK